MTEAARPQHTEITPAAFPDAPKDENVWFGWRYEVPPGQSEVTKVPKRVDKKSNAKVNDPATWAPYEDAVRAFESNRHYYSGIGMVLREDDPTIGIDLDGCRDPETGVVEPWAREIVERLDTYTEVSPSGTGLKLWARGHVPHQSYAKKLTPGEKPGIEIYSQGRWFAVTGWHLEGTPGVLKPRSSELTRLAREHFPDKFQPVDSQGSPESVPTPVARIGGLLDLETWLQDRGVPVTAEAADGKGRKWKLKTCPRSDRHSTSDASGSYVGQVYAEDGSLYGPIYARCSHAGCGGGDVDLWHDLRRTYEPGWEPYAPAFSTVGKAKLINSTNPAGASDGEVDSDAIPKIQVNNRHLRDVTSDALEALILANDPPEVFVRAGALVRVREDEHGTPQIQLMEMNHLRGRLARVADFMRVTENGETKVNPPEVVVKDVMALGNWPFPALEAVVESPILRSDGSIFDTPGYDPKTRLFYRPVPGFECPEIPRDPTRVAIRAALDLINEAIGEFPYGDESSAANTLGLMLTPLVRHAIPGPVPMALIDKPQAGTGGSLLAETIALIGTGRTAEMLGAPRDDEEWRKQITAKLAAGGTMVTVDNVEGALFAPSLARALTARTWTDRILGRSESITLSQRATWIATGNNIILRGDLPRRCYWIRLDAKQSRPWQREGFTHPDLLSWVSEKRGELVGALLTIARAWFAAGRPKAAEVPRLGSFEAWSEIVGGMVAFAGVGGFLGNLKELYDKADEGNAEWEAFLEEWWKHRGEDPITVKALAKLINDEALLKNALPGDLSEALDKGEGSFTRRLGKALAKRAGTRYGEDGLHITEAGEQRRAKLWSVRDSSGECEFVSFVSLYNPSASEFTRNDNTNKGGNTEKTAERGPETNSTNSQTHTSEDGFELVLTEEEERRALKLIDEGMKPSLAREAVYGSEV